MEPELGCAIVPVLNSKIVDNLILPHACMKHDKWSLRLRKKYGKAGPKRVFDSKPFWDTKEEALIRENFQVLHDH